MAQNIDRDCAQAFRAGRNFKRTNTWAFIDQYGESNLLLWGNRIAWTSDNRTKLNINQCGRDTSTTNSRLRALGDEPADDTTTYTMEPVAMAKQKTYSGYGISACLDTCARYGLTKANSKLYIKDLYDLDSAWTIKVF